MDFYLQAIILNLIVLVILLLYYRYDWSLIFASLTDQEIKELEEFLKKKERYIRIAVFITICSLAYLIYQYIINSF